jgi:hypothetical protein
LRQRFFVVPVNGRSVIEVEYSMKGGIPFPFVGRLMTDWEEEKICVSRFDSSHREEPPHQDLMGLRQGLIEKVFYPELDYRHTVAYAIAELKSHGQDLLEIFLQN